MWSRAWDSGVLSPDVSFLTARLVIPLNPSAVFLVSSEAEL